MRPILLGSAFLVSAAIAPAPASAVPGEVVINQFRVRGTSGPGDEFVELASRSGDPVPIGGWTLRGSDNQERTWLCATIPSGVVLGPGCHYLLTHDAGGYSLTVPGDQSFTIDFRDRGGVALLRADGSIADQVAVGAGSAYGEGSPLGWYQTYNLNRGWKRRSEYPGGPPRDFGDNVGDFLASTPSVPQNATSACLVTPFRDEFILDENWNAPPGGSASLVVRVRRVMIPTSTGLAVVLDLTSIGGAAHQAMSFDGLVAYGVTMYFRFSWTGLVAPLTPPGDYILPFVVSDAQGRTLADTFFLRIEGAVPAGTISWGALKGIYR